MRDGIQNNSLTASSVSEKNTEDETQGSPGVDAAACCSGIPNQSAQFYHEIAENDPEDLKTIPEGCVQPVDISNPRSYLLGVRASFAIVGIYLGMNTLTSDWYYARVQFGEYRWWDFLPFLLWGSLDHEGIMP